MATDADLLNVVERVGDPEDIAAEARQRLGITPSRRRWTDVAAIVLLLIGGFTIIGWFVGVVLLWISEVWSTREKIIGTLTLPGGLAGSLAVGAVLSLPGRTSSIGSVELLFLAVLVLIAPVVTAIYLGRRLAQSSREIG